MDRFVWLNACSSGLSVATGISSMATLSTFIGLPVSIPLGATSLAGASVSGVTAALTKKHQRKLSKVTKLTDIATPALAICGRAVSKTLRNGKIDEEEFNLLCTLYLETLNKLIAKWKQKSESKSKKLTGKMNNIQKTIETRNS